MEAKYQLKKISEADEFKINNKVITVEIENMKEKLQHVSNEKNISDEKNEKLQFINIYFSYNVDIIYNAWFKYNILGFSFYFYYLFY